MAIVPSHGKGDCGMRMDTMYDVYGKPVLRQCYNNPGHRPSSAYYVFNDSTEIEICRYPSEVPVLFNNDWEAQEFMRDNLRYAFPWDGSNRAFVGLLINSSGEVIDTRLLKTDMPCHDMDSIALAIGSLITPKKPAYNDGRAVNAFDTVVLFYGTMKTSISW